MDGLGEAGRALWRSVLGSYELSAGELELLHRACVTSDLCARSTAWSARRSLLS